MAQVGPDVQLDDLGEFFDAVVDELNRDVRFTLPRTVVVTGEDEIARLDELLLDDTSTTLDLKWTSGVLMIR